MRKLISILFLICMLSPSFAENKIDFGQPENIQVITDTGSFEFVVEIADTDQERSQGLMFREKMRVKNGMLFHFEETAPVTMWMKNTPLPLDMVFINPDGTVRKVEHDTTPFSRKIISSGGPVSHVLELNAGIANLIGLKAGDRINHRFFSTEN